MKVNKRGRPPLVNMSRDSEKSLKKHPQSAILAGDMSRFLDFYKAKIAGNFIEYLFPGLDP